ncbi:MAG: hypothetical protein ABI778_06870 [Ignavibacteriota bacterium]
MKIPLLLGFLALAATNPLSCSQPVYLPNKIHTPIFHDKGEVVASGAYTWNSGFGGTLAYSPIKSFFVEAGGDLTPAVKPFTPNNSTKFFYGELGYYNCPTSAIELELSGGFGKGTSEVYDNLSEDFFYFVNSPWNYDGNEFDHKTVAFNRFHLQTSLGFHGPLHESESGNHENDIIIEFALTPRVSYLETTNYNIDHIDTTHAIVGTINEHFSNTFLEFGGTLRVGFEHLMLELQAGSSSAIGARRPIPAEGSFLSAGLVSRF